jgi:hypothetical protein
LFYEAQCCEIAINKLRAYKIARRTGPWRTRTGYQETLRQLRR